jgi:probable O-glycosylation ligase (exosortase A-associated)
MRDWVLLAVFVSALPFAVRHTWAGVLLWNWISLMNPHRLAWGFAYFAPFAAVAAGAAILSLVFTKDKLKMPRDAPVVVLFMLVLWMCVTTGIAINPATSWEGLWKVLKIQLMVFVAMAALHSRKHIELFVWVNVLSIGFYGFKGGIFTIQTGGSGRVWGPAGGFIEGNNELAVALVMIIPLMHYLRAVSTRPFIRLGLLALMFMSAIAALGTQSRGALLAIIAMALVYWLRLKKKVVAGITIAAAAAGLVAFMPSSWEERMSSIQTYEEDGSAMGRLVAWRMTINLANDRPWGGGFDIYTREIYDKYMPESALPQAAHSIYFSMLGEHGYIGLILFVLLFALSFRLAGRMRKTALLHGPETAWVHLLASMCQVSIAGFAVGGAFLSLAYYDFAYNIVVMLVVANRWMAERGWVHELNGPFGSAAPGAYVAAKAPMAQSH